MMDPAKVPVVLLCGGRGFWVPDESGTRATTCIKPLVELEGLPVVLHVIGHYLRDGFRSFVLAGGPQHNELEHRLVERTNARRRDAADSSGPAEWVGHLRGQAFVFRIVATGQTSTTGERLRVLAPLLQGTPHFAMSYSDTLSTSDLVQLLEHHLRHNKVATLLATRMPTRFRILGVRYGDPIVRGFAENAVIRNDLINGGYYFFKRDILTETYLDGRAGLTLETHVLEKLVASGELVSHPFTGPWQHLDSDRDLPKLAEIARLLMAASAADHGAFERHDHASAAGTR